MYMVVKEQGYLRFIQKMSMNRMYDDGEHVVADNPQEAGAKIMQEDFDRLEIL